MFHSDDLILKYLPGVVLILLTGDGDHESMKKVTKYIE